MADDINRLSSVRLSENTYFSVSFKDDNYSRYVAVVNEKGNMLIHNAYIIYTG